MIKSRFRAAMASSKLPWANITAKLSTESGGSEEDGANFQVREVIIKRKARGRRRTASGQE